MRAQQPSRNLAIVIAVAKVKLGVSALPAKSASRAGVLNSGKGA